MAANQIKAGQAYVEIGIRNRIAAGARAVQSDLNALSQKATATGGILVATSAALLAPITAATIGFAKAGDLIDKMSLRTGVGAEALSGLGFAAEQFGSDIGAVEKGLHGLSRSMLDLERGSSTAVETYGRLGLSLADLKGLSAEQQLEKVAEALSQIEDESLRGAIAQQIFGRAGRQLLPLLSSGSAGMRELRAEAERLGIVISQEDAAAAAELTDAMNRMKRTLTAVTLEIGGALAPTLTEVTNAIATATRGAIDWASQNRSVVTAVAAAAVAVGVAGAGMLAFGAASKAAALGIGIATAAVGIASKTMAAMSAISAVVRAATLATAATFAAASGSSTAMAAGIALASAAYSASTVVAGAVIGAWGLVGAALTALSAPSALSTMMAGVLSGAWITAAASAASAWITMLAPLAPFLIAGAAVVALAGAIAAGFVALLAVSIDYGAAWGKIKSMLSGIVSVINDVFTTIKDALVGGEYSAAATALWAGVRLAFWEGVAGAMDAFSWLWKEAIATGTRMFVKLIEIAWKSMSMIGDLITNPFTATSAIANGIGSIMSSASGFDVSGRADAARAELKAIRDAMAAKKEKAKVDEEAKAAATEEAAAQEELAEAFQNKIRAIELEIVALEQGEDAAERMRLADEGLTESQIEQIQILKDKKKAIEDAADAEKKAADEAKEAAEKLRKDRLDQGMKDLEAGAKQMAAAGMLPDEIFQATMQAIGEDEKNGVLDNAGADELRDQARANLDQSMDRLRSEGEALADALRTPAEVLNDELKQISQLQDAGVISGETALRGEDAARKKFMESQESIDNAVERSGPSGDFSASAAAIIGMGPRFENEQLKASQETAKNTRDIARQNKKDQIARFA